MASGTFSPVEALAISSGKIIASGSLSSAQSAAGSDATMIDLNQRCLLPGFVEPHLHLLLTALTVNFFVNVQPSTITTRAEAIKVLAAAAENTKEGHWVAAFGYDPSRVKGNQDLDVHELDTASTTVPILVINQSGHLAYVNTKAFELAGVTDSTPNPSGGSYGKDDNGHLTGVIYETPAIDRFGRRVKSPSVEKVLSACSQALKEWSSKGCTTVFDAGIGLVGPKSQDVAAMEALKSMPVRFIGAVAEFKADHIVGKQHPPIRKRNVTIQAIKFWAGGSTQGFTAAVNDPYLHTTNRGTLNHSDDQLQTAMTSWMEKGWQLSIHSNGDSATSQSLRSYAAVFAKLPNRDTNIMHRIEHFTVSEPEQVKQAKELGLGVSHTIGHVYYWGDAFQNLVLGPERASRIDPIADDVANDVVFSFHSDSPLTEPDPPLYVRTAVTRMMQNTSDVLGPEQRVRLEDALKGVTINPAKQLLLGDTIGSLEVGKAADLVILDQDPRDVDPTELHTLKVQETWLGGRKVYDITGTAP